MKFLPSVTYEPTILINTNFNNTALTQSNVARCVNKMNEYKRSYKNEKNITNQMKTKYVETNFFKFTRNKPSDIIETCNCSKLNGACVQTINIHLF